MTLKQTEMTFLWSQKSIFVCMTEINSNYNIRVGVAMQESGWEARRQASMWGSTFTEWLWDREVRRMKGQLYWPRRKNILVKGNKNVPTLSGGNVADCLGYKAARVGWTQEALREIESGCTGPSQRLKGAARTHHRDGKGLHGPITAGCVTVRSFQGLSSEAVKEI